MSFVNSPLNYANTEDELERILNESLNNCVILKQDINDILLTKSVYLYVANLLKPIITSQAIEYPDIKSKCISCYTESANVLNICKCGLENLCYTCILAKYMPILTDNIKANKAKAVQTTTSHTNIFDKQYMLTLLQNTVFCNYCKVTGRFHNTLNNMQATEPIQNNNHNHHSNQQKHLLLHETDFLHLETKTLIDIFPNMDMSSFIKHTNTETITNYGFELEFNTSGSFSFKLNGEFIESIIRKMTQQHKRMIITATIQCNAKLITPSIFNAIYYKCIDFGIKNNVLDQRLLFNWNKFCQKMNKLLAEYGHDSQMNYYISVVLLNEIKGISVI